MSQNFDNIQSRSRADILRELALIKGLLRDVERKQKRELIPPSASLPNPFSQPFLRQNTSNGLVEFAEALAWKGQQNVVYDWKLDYQNFLRNYSKKIIAHTPLITAAVGAFTDHQLAEVLMSPQISSLLIKGGSQNDFEVELNLGLVKALAERHKLASVSSSPTTRRERIRDLSLDFDSSFLNDFDIPFLCDDRPSKSIEVTPWSLVPTTQNTLERVLDALDQCSHTAYEFVISLTSVIVVRRSSGQGRGYLAGSFTEYPGVTLFVNPWHQDLACLIDSIVHESIHHAISMYEAVHGSITIEAPTSLRYRSPWSGNLLTLHQFVEACFVWWGLYNLWRHWPAESHFVAKQRVNSLRDTAGKGLIARPTRSVFDRQAYSLLQPDTLRAIEFIEKSVENTEISG